MREFQPETIDPDCAPVLQVLRCFLRLRAKNRVAAADVGHYRMRASRDVAQLDAVRFAWPAAITIARAGREEAAEDAVFGVEHRQVLVDDHLEWIATDLPRKFGDLLCVQIVGGRNRLNTHG